MTNRSEGNPKNNGIKILFQMEDFFLTCTLSCHTFCKKYTSYGGEV
jgi:hypothetical protein